MEGRDAGVALAVASPLLLAFGENRQNAVSRTLNSMMVAGGDASDADCSYHISCDGGDVLLRLSSHHSCSQ